jgi:hypothetical protein
LRRRRPEDTPVVVPLPAMTTSWQPAHVEALSGPAVTLGFRDGSTVEVSPDSLDGQALRTAAAAIVDRNADT